MPSSKMENDVSATSHHEICDSFTKRCGGTPQIFIPFATYQINVVAHMFSIQAPPVDLALLGERCVLTSCFLPVLVGSTGATAVAVAVLQA